MRGEKKCIKHHCYEKPYCGGFCRKHYEGHLIEENLYNGALEALHEGTIEGHYPKNAELQDELIRIQEWWFRACRSENYNMVDDILQDEAKYAVEWCISLAKEIVRAEIAFRNGQAFPLSLERTREWVWDRFHNLEIGLMSNGVERVR
ncbi:MAG: hypothetical protein ABIK12_05685 [Pseudomonadota bacterium]